ncbi:hypothetical protein NADFUDRAFT_39945 [Nadsonia fulvescens var. elongata DSM 6958]|uniref:Splicing factor Cactin n=1 Tax=Nadsonia fulvescens var. elongata DSM 6958 TaxID=857566 RepID=A0A1E3PT25_9ASCO|nr:hypothetical protein NADFUDRAFT_39945 [Nadsonia fulvescens var. elongata DSM 6958]
MSAHHQRQKDVTDHYGRELRDSQSYETSGSRARSRSPEHYYSSSRDKLRRCYSDSRDKNHRGNYRGSRGNANSQGYGRGAQDEERKSLDWIKQEDIFALRQKRLGSVIRVKEDRAKFIDHLLVNLLLAEYEVTRSSIWRADTGLPKGDPQDEIALTELFGDMEHIDEEIKSVNTLVYSDLIMVPELEDLVTDIIAQVDLETKAQKTSHYKPILAREYWSSNMIIIRNRIREMERQQKASPGLPNLIMQDVHNILKDKSYQDLINLEIRVKQNIDAQSNKDFWISLHEHLLLKKARMKLNELGNYANAARFHFFKLLQNNEAIRAQINLKNYMSKKLDISKKSIFYSLEMDKSQNIYPTSGLTYRTLDEWIQDLQAQRKTIQQSGFIIMKSHPRFRQPIANYQHPFQHHHQQTLGQSPASKTGEFIRKVGSSVPFPKEIKDDEKHNSSLDLFKREESRRVNDDEQLLTEEKNLSTNTSTNNNANNPNMIKPRYHNRVILGYDWNAYNKAHYDSENKPPKMVQGYRFNLYYPDLPSGSAPTYKIIRDSRSQDTSGETIEKTCIIRFSAGFPYQDISFRIIDKAWDQGSHRGSMYRSKFDRGLLQLHFKFKKTVYRR